MPQDEVSEFLEPNAAEPLPDPWAVLNSADEDGTRWTSSAPGFAARALDARRLELRGEFPAGLARFELLGRDAGFDVESLTLRLRFTPGWDPNEPDPAAPPTGPWDYINGDFVVPRYALDVDGEAHPEFVWLDLPWAEDVQARRARSSFALRFERAGSHVIVLDFTRPDASDARLGCASWREIRIGRDERDACLEPRLELRPELEGRRPRLWLTPERLEALRRDVAPGGARRGLFEKLRARCADPQRLDLLGLGLLALLDEDGAGWAARAVEEGERLAAEPHWGVDRPGHMGCDNDIAAGGNLLVLSLLRDWLRAAGALEAERDARWRAKLLHHGRLMFRFALLQRSYLPTGYLQNHFSASYMGLGVAGLELADDPDAAAANEARSWFNFVAGEFRRRSALSPPDGSGCPLDVSYGLRFYVHAAQAYASATGARLLEGPFYAKLPEYWMQRLWHEQGLAGYRSILWPVARCAGHAGLLAKLCESLAETEAVGAEDLLWADGEPPGGRADVALTGIFADCGEAYLHADPHAERARDTWVSLQAGVPFGATHNRRLTRYNYAHYMPNRGEVRLRHRGKTVLGDGGRSYRKLTSLHNVLTFDETGQFGDAFVWMPKPRLDRCGRLSRVEDAGAATQAAMDLAAAYPDVRGLKSYRRHVLFVRDARAPLLVLVDRVAFEPDCEVRMLRWHFHAPQVEGAPGSRAEVLLGEDEVRFALTMLQPAAGVEAEIGETELVKQYTWRGPFQRHVTWSWPRENAGEAAAVFVARPAEHGLQAERGAEGGWTFAWGGRRVELALDGAADPDLRCEALGYAWRA
ncbi:MAG: heparinase II/III-family protein [Planctomycetota bacterium]|nr:heparinase II/III-family protein [Planctomycetota bacterium]